VDEVHGMLAGTKKSVDHLLPKSEELLSQNERQERAISHIHNDLREKTNAIMKELSDVYYYYYYSPNDTLRFPRKKFQKKFQKKIPKKTRLKITSVITRVHKSISIRTQGSKSQCL
jgi:hypothetical protein